MKIEKFVKDKQNKYKVTIDREDYILYDDVIVKYELIRKSEIDEKKLKEILDLNDELQSYYDSIKYITKKLRSEKEIREFLSKKNISPKIITKTIKRLKENNFLNEEVYLKCYINDQINLTNNGPKKIKSNLLKLGIDEELIDEAISKIDTMTFEEKIENYISKKIKTNHSSSSYMLRIKISNDLINLGFDKEIVNEILSRYNISDKEVYEKELEKAKKKFSKKYSGYELDQKIKAYLYRKGFKVSNLEEGSYEE